MADIKQLNVNGTVYDIKDEVARRIIPAHAEVGQTIVVSEVDENGNPSRWEAVNFPDGGNSGGNSGGGGGSEQIVIGLFYDDAAGESFANSKFHIFDTAENKWNPVSVSDLHDILVPRGAYQNCVLCYGYFDGSDVNMMTCDSCLVNAFEKGGGKVVAVRGICCEYGDLRKITAQGNAIFGQETYSHMLYVRLNAQFEAIP